MPQYTLWASDKITPWGKRITPEVFDDLESAREYACAYADDTGEEVEIVRALTAETYEVIKSR